MTVKFDTYYRYEALAKILHEFAEAFPKLVELSSIGKSYEGRDIFLLSLSNQDIAPAHEKPALWIDGNIHATEVSPSSACLYLIKTLLEGYGKDETITRALDSRTFYICPRVNPDGAEWALADKPKLIRSSTRPYPYDEVAIEGLKQEDIDGDGRMLMMRIQDDNGPWKLSDKDERLLVRREATEVGGTYYRVLPEGSLTNYDGVSLKAQKIKEGLDLNRNFPANWRPEGEQKGAGPFPASEPEVRSIMTFISEHKNIFAGITFHTWSGVLLRPFSHKSDEEGFAAEDLWTYKKIGDKGTELTGYPNLSVFHEFRYHPKEVITGAFDDWLFDHLGLFAWTVEIWSPQKQAGIEEYKFIDWYREHPHEDDLRMLKWSDEVLEGKGYVDWYEFDHPQLGKLELGGWDMFYAWRNPPPQFLERELARFPDWCIWHALISPKLEIHSHELESLGKGTYRIQVVVHNTGWLPSYVTKHALEKKLVRGIVSEITIQGGSLITGKLREEHGQLEGRAYKASAANIWSAVDPSDDRLKLEWVANLDLGSKVTIKLRHERSGVVELNLEI